MPTPTPDHQTLQEAADWFARLSSEPHNAAQQHAWQQWLDHSDSHRQAWRYVERVSQRFAPLQDDRETASRALQALHHTPTSRRQVLRTLSVISGGLLLGALAWRHDALTEQLLAWQAGYRTGTGEILERTLADGSRIWLNSATALDVELSTSQRNLRLYEGEVLIATGSDPRPFIVHTAQGSLSPLGTRFSVRERATRTQLNVYDGAVQVRCAVSHQTHVAKAGEGLSFDEQGATALEPAQPGRESWSKGVLLAQDMPLPQFIDELADYRHGHLGLAPGLAHLRVMGTFPLQDTDQVLSMLEGVLPIRIEQTFPGWTTVKPR